MDAEREPTELPFSSADGAESALRVFEPPGLAENVPVMLMMPALGVRASFYGALSEPLASVGLRLATCDLRGHGLSRLRPGRRSDFGFRQMVEMDWPAAVTAIGQAYPDAPVILMGHSLGGKLSLLFAAANPGAVAAVVTVASCSVYWKAFAPSRRLGLLAMTQLTAVIGRVWGSYPGHRLGFGGHEARGVMADWAYQARTGRYRVKGSQIDYEAALAGMATPALMISIEGDGYAPASAADHLASKLPSPRRLHLNDQRLRALKAPHFRWVAQAEPVVTAIKGWLDSEAICRGVAPRPQ